MQSLIFATALVLAAILYLAARRPQNRWRFVAATAGVLVGGLVFLSPRSHRESAALTAELPKRVQGDGFVSANTCRSCHPDEHAAETRSHHSQMTQVASPETVVGEFKGELTAWGRTYRLERRGDEFWIELPDPDIDLSNIRSEIDPSGQPNPEMVWKQVVMTTGSHWMQGYWVPLSEDRGLLQFPFIWLVDTKDWIRREDTFLYPDSWKQRPMPAMWNIACIRCHSTGGKPEINQRNKLVDSSVVDFGVACESCHGPGEEHVAFNRKLVRRITARFSDGPDDTIVNPARLPHDRASMVCGQCHAFFGYRNQSAWEREGDLYRAGDDLELTRHILVPPGSTWKDGSVRIGGVLEYKSLAASACYKSGQASCMSCHNMHESEPRGGLLREGFDGDQACTQCHQSYGDDLQAHSHHAPESEGSRCMNCHMPHSTTVLFHNVRSHRIDSPTAAMSVRHDRPNACNMCHLDKTLEWTARTLTEWYDQPETELSQDAKKYSATVRWLLSGNASQRAVLAWQAAWAPARAASGDDWLVPYLAQLLADPYSMIRRIAWLSLRTFPGYSDFAFDPGAGPDQHREAVARALALWQPPPPGRFDEAVLFAPDGTFQRDEFRLLLSQRDDYTPPQTRRPGTGGDAGESFGYGAVGSVGQ